MIYELIILFLFFSLWEILQSLYFAAFGLIDLKHFDLKEDHGLTRFVGRLMFGTYSTIVIIVLINMLIAMLSNSYMEVSVRCRGGHTHLNWVITDELIGPWEILINY